MFIEFLRDIYKYFKLLRFKKKFRKKNVNNFTKTNRIFDLKRVQIGNYTYGNLNIFTFGNENEYLKIGNFCSIANDVVFLLSGEHNYKNLSTYPYKSKFGFQSSEALCKGKIIIGDDVWIGENTIILSGVKIGQGAVIGAGSVVFKDIPPYSIYAGNKVLKKRFSDDIIDKLLEIDYNKLNSNFVKENIDEFYSEVNLENIDEFLNHLKKE